MGPENTRRTSLAFDERAFIRFARAFSKIFPVGFSSALSRFRGGGLLHSSGLLRSHGRSCVVMEVVS